ncbi:MAG: shikimate kinase [Acidobacteria bacterium]|nr:shikimate kinase [Acidobacteriota bacterium]
MADTDKLYLVGFMGAGKTTVGGAVARRLGWRLEDLDERIEQLERRSIAEIFRLQGEPYFRAREREVLMALVPERHVVVASGGGTFIDPANRAAMLADGTVVWLDLPLELLIERVPVDGRRPLAATREAMKQLYVARQAAYREAHLRLTVGRGPVEETVERLLHLLCW